MECNDVRERLTDYCRDELSSEDATTVATHLKSCEACEAQRQQLSATFDMMTEAWTPEPLPEGAGDRLRLRLEREKKGSVPLRPASGRLGQGGRGMRPAYWALSV
ncbi:MAG: anti-sigma factor family protein, partial [Planctomycetota bacterium]